MELVFERGIGFVYDICQIIICKTARRESWINSYILEGQEESDIEKLDSSLRQFRAVDSCWNIITFLHPQKGRLLSKLFVEFMKNADEHFDESDFVEYISESNLLRNRICAWYFDNVDIGNEECFIKLQQLKNCGIDDGIRLQLFDFLVSLDEYMLEIKNSIRDIVVEMSAFYQLKAKQLESKIAYFRYIDEKQEELLFPNSLSWENKINHCTVSFSLINRYAGMRDELLTAGFGWILLGIDYDAEVNHLEKEINLVGFGNSIGDKVRFKILKEIHKNGEQTLTDLSRTFNLVNAVMLYHLDILRRERLLGQRHEGRRVYYWLNYSQLKKTISALISEFGGEWSESMEQTDFN